MDDLPEQNIVLLNVRSYTLVASLSHHVPFESVPSNVLRMRSGAYDVGLGAAREDDIEKAR